MQTGHSRFNDIYFTVLLFPQANSGCQCVLLDGSEVNLLPIEDIDGPDAISFGELHR